MKLKLDMSREGTRSNMYTLTVRLNTSRSPEFVDITDQVCNAIQDSKVWAGFAVVYSRHTTAAIIINEMEPLLLRDMERFLEDLAPRDNYYQHNDFSIRTVNMAQDEFPNGHAHCQHLMLGTSETIPILDGRPQFGQWQRIFLVELDRPRNREFLVQILGI